MKRYLIILFTACIGMSSLCSAQPEVVTIFAERPKVALVLSGGGARGAAHVGVIRLIEEMQIPIDMVTGTSMGAIVGALYAIGYTADEMDSLLMVQDWDMLLSNGVPRAMQPYVQRKAEQQYQVNIPYTKKGRTETTARYRDAGIKVQKHSLRGFPKVLARPGLIDGQNLLNLFTELTMAYHDSLHYRSLPRQYACVATDLVTGDAVVLDQGFLAESMRASMSIPGVFYPIYKDNQVLVDGGVVNNYPVDVARAMGADIVIGVDLSTGDTSVQSLQSFPAIFERLIGTLGSELRRRNVQSTDVLIRPQVSAFPVMGFDTVHLSQLVNIGYETAQKHKEALERVKKQTEVTASAGSNQSEVPGTDTGLYLIAEIDAVPEVRLQLAQCGIVEGGVTTPKALSDAIERVYGLGIYASVQYHLLGDEACRLVVEAVPNPHSQVELGLRFDSEETAAAQFSVGVNRLQQVGPKFDFTTRLSMNPWVEVHGAYAFCRQGQVNAALKCWYSDVNRLYSKNNQTLDYHFYGGDVYLSGLLSRYYDLRLGVRYDYFLLHNLTGGDLLDAAYLISGRHDSYVGVYAAWRNDLFDAPYLPTSGYAYAWEVVYNSNMQRYGGGDFFSLQASTSAAWPLGRFTVLQPSLHLRWLFGDDIPLVYGNSLGGYLPGRYLRQQLPFVGFVGCEFTACYLTVLGVELRQQLLSDVYLSAIANYANSANRFSEMFGVKGMWGLALGLTYNTTIGPLSFNGYWNDQYHRLGAYVSLGYDF